MTASDAPEVTYAVLPRPTPPSGGPLSAAATAATVLVALAAVLGILALATSSRGGNAMPFADYLAGWRQVHGLEPDRMVGGFVEAYLRLPYSLARPLARRGASPNLVTLGGLLLAAASIPAYLAGGAWLLAAGLAVLVSGFCDQLDGAVAVMQGRATAFGAVWDSTVDRLSDLVLLVGPATWLLRDVEGSVTAPGLWGLAASGASLFLLEYVRARSQAVGYVAAQVVTPAERPTRVVMTAVVGLLCGALLAGGAEVRTAGVVWLVSAWALTTLTVVSVGLLLADARRRGDPTTPTTGASG